VNRTKIYYFSGTGNSLAVARRLADKLNAPLTPVASTTSEKSIDAKADTIGLVFPIYDFKPPQMIDDLVAKLETIDSTYLFAVCTYGIAPTHALTHLEKVIESSGGHLSGGFAIAMPHNGIGGKRVSQARRDKLLEAWEGKTDEIYNYVRARAEGRIESSPLLLIPFQRGMTKMIPPLFNFLTQMLTKGADSLAFTASATCDGCGICERVCPTRNIEMVDDQPTWSDRCVMCFACLHWCPKEAISLGGCNLDIGSYHHPDAKLADMLRSAQQATSSNQPPQSREEQ